MAKYTFKDGDRVQFKEWDEMEKEFGLNLSGSIKCYLSFATGMRYLCGTYATIKEIFLSGTVTLSEFSTRGSPFWAYSTDMLKPASTKKQKVDEPKSEVKEAFGFKHGDKVNYCGMICTVVGKCNHARNVLIIKHPHGGYSGFCYDSEPWEKLEGNYYWFVSAEELTRVENKPITHPTITAHLIEGNKTTVMLSDGRIGEVTCYYKDTFDPAVGVAEAYKKALGTTKAEDNLIPHLLSIGHNYGTICTSKALRKMEKSPSGRMSLW